MFAPVVLGSDKTTVSVATGQMNFTPFMHPWGMYKIMSAMRIAMLSRLSAFWRSLRVRYIIFFFNFVAF
jgi:hypothetical protein